MFRDEFVVKKRFLDERWSFNFFSREKMYGNELNHVYIHSFRSIIKATEKFPGGGGIWTAFRPREGGIWTKILQKIQMPGGCPGEGDVEASIWLVHNSKLNKGLYCTLLLLQQKAVVWLRIYQHVLSFMLFWKWECPVAIPQSQGD